MNTKLLLEVRKLILEEPRRFNMDYFAATDEFYPHVVHRQTPPCGTVACIAGWATIEHARAEGRSDLSVDFLNGIGRRTGAQALGLDEAQSSRLFFTEEWPDDLAVEYRDAYLQRDYALAAEVAARRIDRFIKTDGAE